MKIISWMTRFGLVALIIFVGFPAGSASMAGGYRIQVQVDEPFEIGGVVYPAGQLSVKVLRDYTPSTTLNEVWVGNTCLGMFVARNSRDDLSNTNDDSIVFTRDDGGRLVLAGYVFVGSERNRIFR